MMCWEDNNAIQNLETSANIISSRPIVRIKKAVLHGSGKYFDVTIKDYNDLSDEDLLIIFT